MEIHCTVSITSSRLRHHQMVKQIVTSSLKNYQILFSISTMRTKITILMISLIGQGPSSIRLPTQSMTNPQGRFGGATTDDLFQQPSIVGSVKQINVEVRLL
jgi:hypothetical protein